MAEYRLFSRGDTTGRRRRSPYMTAAALAIVLFLVVSGVLLAVVAPWARKASRVNPVATNADRHIGRQALVTEEIDNLKESGAIRLDGVIWTARSESGEVIPEGATITVKRIAGAKAYVERATEPAEV